MAQKLAQQLELAVGILSGAYVIVAILLDTELGLAATVIALLCKSNKKYLSTSLLREELVCDGHLASNLYFIDYQFISYLTTPRIRVA